MCFAAPVFDHQRTFYGMVECAFEYEGAVGRDGGVLDKVAFAGVEEIGYAGGIGVTDVPGEGVFSGLSQDDAG